MAHLVSVSAQTAGENTYSVHVVSRLEHQPQDIVKLGASQQLCTKNTSTSTASHEVPLISLNIRTEIPGARAKNSIYLAAHMWSWFRKKAKVFRATTGPNKSSERKDTGPLLTVYLQQPPPDIWPPHRGRSPPGQTPAGASWCPDACESWPGQMMRMMREKQMINQQPVKHHVAFMLQDQIWCAAQPLRQRLKNRMTVLIRQWIKGV